MHHKCQKIHCYPVDKNENIVFEKNAFLTKKRKEWASNQIKTTVNLKQSNQELNEQFYPISNASNHFDLFSYYIYEFFQKLLKLSFETDVTICVLDGVPASPNRLWHVGQNFSSFSLTDKKLINWFEQKLAHDMLNVCMTTPQIFMKLSCRCNIWRSV